MLRQIGFPEFVVVLVIVALLLYGRFGPAFRDMFRGGPRPPSHPLPGDDSRFLTRRRSKAASDV
ncbi:MAG TPA: hypothetical protein VMH80_16335 [Bryobacteraceae bacterium]|nr:hypothetical protein [Bryobacteraceae bacterium]